jgi:hypothetical protein
MGRGASTSGTEHAAPAVGQSDLPECCNSALPKLIDMLRWAIQSERGFPERAELRKRFRNAAKATELLLCELQDLTFFGILDRVDGRSSAFNLSSLCQDLRVLAERVEKALPNLPTQHGPTDKESISSMELCALIAGLVWENRFGKWPGKNRVDAHRLCEALWKRAGGSSRRGWGKPNSIDVWRNHLKSAAKNRDGHAAAEIIRRQINELGDEEESKRRRAEREIAFMKLVAKVHSRQDRDGNGG